MKLILIIITFILFSSFGSKNYYVKLVNYTKHTKYILVKYENKEGKTVTKEIKLKKKQRYGFFVYNSIFYLYSVSFVKRGMPKEGVFGNDGIGFIRKILNGKPAHYKKIDCEMQLRGIFKTVHLGI